MEGEDVEPRFGISQLPEDATAVQKEIWEAITEFCRSELATQALIKFTHRREREFVHQLADEVGIYHRSDGKGRFRHVVLAKSAPTVPSARYDPESECWKPCTLSYLHFAFEFDLFISVELSFYRLIFCYNF